MSSDHAFHVHGPHDHEVEHAAHGGDAFSGRIAVMTAIFATIGAFFGYMAGATQNEALLFKNEAAIKTLEASDQWNFYQAKSSKQNLADLGATLTTGDTQARYQKEIERYKKEKDDIMVTAKKLEDAGKEATARSAAEMHVHHRWAQAMMLIQIAIALAAITILTRNRGLMYAAYGAAGGALQDGSRALQQGKAGHHDQRAGAREEVGGARGEERGGDARASPLGAGDDADPDLDRARRDHAAHA